MIIVLADDFTGAAEMAGVGLMHGLKVELSIEGIYPSSADLLIIVTNTRSKGLDEALNEVRSLSEKIINQKPDWIYKKMDSLLRGNILEESKTMADALGVKGAVIIPANPGLGRVLFNGQYFIDGFPIQQTSFFNDPKHKISDSSISSLLKRNGSALEFDIRKPADYNTERNIIVGEASTNGDLDLWADGLPVDWLPVGAAGFFQSLLLSKGMPLVNGNRTSGIPEDAKALYLCGSTFQDSREMVASASISGQPVSYMPENLFWNLEGCEECLEKWIEDTVALVRKHNKVIIAVQEPVILENGQSNWVKHNLALLVKGIFSRTGIQELIIEGGSTASSVITNMGLSRLTPLHQFQQGVIRMRAEDIPGLNLTLKPGSYNWPETLWKF